MTWRVFIQIMITMKIHVLYVVAKSQIPYRPGGSVLKIKQRLQVVTALVPQSAQQHCAIIIHFVKPCLSQLEYKKMPRLGHLIYFAKL